MIYSESFYVGRNNPKFPTARNGYLSALKELPDQEESKSLPQPEWSERQWDKVRQLEAEIVGWRKVILPQKEVVKDDCTNSSLTCC